jgi:CubicO group peptidase (beta-lactamase class C family)
VSAGSVRPDVSRAEHHQAVIDRYQAERRLPSLVAGVLDGPELAWSGFAGAESSTDLQHRIGSITKTMTALLVVQCRDEGLLDLDDPIGRVLPAGGYADATVRALLAHVSGMQSEPVGPWWERSPGVSVEALLAANDGSGAVFGPGEHFHYSNLGYGLLGAAVERLRGAPWPELVAERVLQPLGMSRTSYLPEPPYAEGFSVHHLAGTLTSEPLHDTGAMAPAGQLWSTIEDLTAFAAFLADGNPEVLADDSLAEMRQPVPPALDYGLGVRLVPYRAGVLVGHTGSMPGFQATLFADPLNKVGVVALTNGTTGFSGDELALALLGDHTPAPLEPWRPATEVPEWAEELLGYWHWGNSAFEVRWHDDALEWRDLARSRVAERFTREGDRIVGVAGYHHGETLHVVRHHDGRIRRLECATFVYTRRPYEDE